MSARFSNPRDLRRAATESRFRVKCFARLLGLQVRTLERRFIHVFGCSPDQWLAEQRMREAARLLQEGFNTKEVAAELAYQHASSFCRQFRRRFGCTPAEAATARTGWPGVIGFPLSQTANTLSQTANPSALRSADGI